MAISLVAKEKIEAGQLVKNDAGAAEVADVLTDIPFGIALRDAALGELVECATDGDLVYARTVDADIAAGVWLVADATGLRALNSAVDLAQGAEAKDVNIVGRSTLGTVSDGSDSGRVARIHFSPFFVHVTALEGE